MFTSWSVHVRHASWYDTPRRQTMKKLFSSLMLPVMANYSCLDRANG